MGCLTDLLLLLAIIIVLIILGYGAFAALMGGASIVAYFTAGTAWAIKKLKSGNPILFIILACIGVVFVIFGYYEYFDYRHNLIYLYGAIKEMSDAHFEQALIFNKEALDRVWNKYLPWIISGFSLIGIGAVGSFVVYYLNRNKRNK